MVVHNTQMINEIQKAQPQAINQITQAKPAETFRQVLENKIGESSRIQFSKHAGIRLAARNLSLSAEQIKRVEDGVAKAREKGVRDSLVMVDGVALVVNIASKTVITAIQSNAQNVFTNIDGAVVV